VLVLEIPTALACTSGVVVPVTAGGAGVVAVVDVTSGGALDTSIGVEAAAVLTMVDEATLVNATLGGFCI